MVMKLRSFKALFFSLLVLLVLLNIAACSGDSDGIKSTKNTGSATFSIQWPDSALKQQISRISQASSITNIDCATLGVETVYASMTSSGEFVNSSWPCSVHSGTINNIPEGSGYVTEVIATDTYGNQLFKGNKSGINITAGQNTNIGIVTLESVDLGEPSAHITSPAGGFVFRNGKMELVDQTIDVGSYLSFEGYADSGRKPYMSYSWNFNGGALNSSAQNPGNVTFNTPGSYPVIFTVTDANGNMGYSSPLNIIVQATQSSSTPTLTAVIASPKADETITAGQSLMLLGSAIGGMAPYAYQWNYEVGGSNSENSTAQNPEEILYNTPGIYLITLQVTDANGKTSSASVNINVQTK